MKKVACKSLYLLFFLVIGFLSHAQKGEINIKQDPKIDSLLNKKIELDRERFSKEYYTLQLYYGNLDQANEILKISKEKFPNISAELSFETPNYKIHAGRFKDKIKGLKTLDTLKRTFPAAFLLVKRMP